MFKRFWSILLVTCAVLLSSSTLVSAEPRHLKHDLFGQSNLSVRSFRGAAPLVRQPGSPSSTSEPGDDDAPNKDGQVVGHSRPVLLDGLGKSKAWSLTSLRTGIRMHLLKYFSALR
jgi:hypothetical protein